MALIKELTIIDIIERKIEFIEKSNIYNEIDLEYVKDGEIRAYREMLLSINKLTEKDFIKKYLSLVKKLNTFFEEEGHKCYNNIENERLVGYNNAVVFVLSLLNPEYEFDIK